MVRHAHIRAGRDLSDPIYEFPGPITSDSLAAESVYNNGTFSQNADSTPLDVLSDNATFATTDTSAARVIPSAPFAEARPTTYNGIYTESVDDADTLADLAAADTIDYGGVDDAAAYGYPTAASTRTTTTYTTAEPSITEVDYVDRPGTTARTRGPDVFEDDSIAESPTTANASWNSGVGTLSDPSRIAEYEFEGRGALGAEQNATPTARYRGKRDVEDYSLLDVDEEV